MLVVVLFCWSCFALFCIASFCLAVLSCDLILLLPIALTCCFLPLCWVLLGLSSFLLPGVALRRSYLLCYVLVCFCWLVVWSSRVFSDLLCFLVCWFAVLGWALSGFALLGGGLLCFCVSLLCFAFALLCSASFCIALLWL